MDRDLRRTSVLVFLAVVFTAGLTFATLELPQLLDGFIQRAVTMPGGDSHADEVSRLKTELFMAYYHVRALGYTAFFLLLALIVAGFVSRRTGLAAFGAFGVMLAVFAQFASVMFFLAGLGILNAIWLPVLDVSWELQNWGRVIDLPGAAVRWVLGLVGVSSPWPTILFFLVTGILLFVLGTYAWLSARIRGRGVAEGLVYRISRHPQYLGWILWTYGMYLLIQLAHYPRRSWGIGASLPWLVSTLVIIAVALVEELRMRERHGEQYERYRGTAPFLFPLPRWLARALASPLRLLFGRDRPERVREVVSLVGLYGALLIGTSAFFYGGGMETTLARLSSPKRQTARMQALLTEAVAAPDLHRRRYNLLREVASFGEPAIGPLTGMLASPDATLRALAVEVLEELPPARTIATLAAAAADPDETVRLRAIRALGATRLPAARPVLLARLDDAAGEVRFEAFTALASLGAEEILARASEYLTAEGWWTRARAVSSLGSLGSEAAVPLVVQALDDTEASVRRDAVVALLQIRSPLARPALERALADPDYEVRLYAAEALKRLPSVKGGET